MDFIEESYVWAYGVENASYAQFLCERVELRGIQKALLKIRPRGADGYKMDRMNAKWRFCAEKWIEFGWKMVD